MPRLSMALIRSIQVFYDAFRMDIVNLVLIWSDYDLKNLNFSKIRSLKMESMPFYENKRGIEFFYWGSSF